MARFLGRFDYSIDAKGRVNIPAKFRKAMSPEAAETVIICRAPNGCLRVYPSDEWAKIEADIASRPETPESLRHKRLLFSTISDSVFDAQGRISLTPAQMSIASITKELTLVGQGDCIEIWDTAKYNAYLEAEEGNFDAMFFESVKSGLNRQ
jgi:MraZ protein